MAKMEHSIDINNEFGLHKKYDMLKRQFEYLLLEMNLEINFVDALKQKKQLQSISNKFDW